MTKISAIVWLCDINSLGVRYFLAIGMANILQKLVSKKKRRFQEDGFDLDMTCLSSRILMFSLRSLVSLFVTVRRFCSIVSKGFRPKTHRSFFVDSL